MFAGAVFFRVVKRADIAGNMIPAVKLQTEPAGKYLNWRR